MYWLSCGLGRFNRLVQFALGGAKVLFGLCAVAGHIVMISGARMLHLVDRLNNVVVDGVQIVPVMNSFGKCDPSSERQAERNKSKSFLHSFTSHRECFGRRHRRAKHSRRMVANTITEPPA